MSCPPKATYLTVSKLRKHCNQLGKRLSPDFVLILDNFIRQKLNAACAVHNGGRKTIDAAVAGFVGLTKPNNPSNE